MIKLIDVTNGQTDQRIYTWRIKIKSNKTKVMFLYASSHIYKSLSVRPSVCLSVGPFVRASIHFPFIH